MIETNLVQMGQDVTRAGIEATEASRAILLDLFEKIRQALGAAKMAIVDNDEVAAQSILHLKDEVNQLVYQALQLQAQRLKSEGADDIDVTMFENELIDSMKRIYSLSKRIAKLTVPDSLIQEAA